MVVIRWKGIFESLEAGVDACEHAAHVLEGVSIKRRSRAHGLQAGNARAAGQERRCRLRTRPPAAR